jgi:hypothetical protein
MKAFWSGMLMMVVISVLAWAVLGIVDMSAEGVFTSGQGSVRL